MSELKFTCISCRVAFHDPEIQRLHYKTDWHRYNLKRKVAELPAVTAEEFQRRVLNQRELDLIQNTPVSIHCKICRKSFNTQNSYDNHLNSKKHKELSENVETAENDTVIAEPATASNVRRSVKKPSVNDEDDMETDSEVEEVDSDEWDDEEGIENPVLNNNCLFCDHHSRNMVKNLKHMTTEHSFFIPDIEYVVDMQGLLVYLGEKVFEGFMCLWCNDRGRTFYTAEAAQSHMKDKGHTKMLHEGEALAEYAEFYDYSTSYPDREIADGDEEVVIPEIDDSDFQLVLPSGATIGHRSLMRYYKQTCNPNRALVHTKKLHNVLSTYRALGWTETQQVAASKKARDIHYMKRVQNKHYAKLGIKANKLQTYYRPQVLF